LFPINISKIDQKSFECFSQLWTFMKCHFCFTLVCFHPMSNYFFYSLKSSLSSITWIWKSILDQHTQHYGVSWAFTPTLCIQICYGVSWNFTPTSCIQIWRYYKCTFSSFDSLLHWVFQILILQIVQNDLKWHVCSTYLYYHTHDMCPQFLCYDVFVVPLQIRYWHLFSSKDLRNHNSFQTFI
jgi:hypothetical protein